MDSYTSDDIKYMALSLLGRKDKPDFVTSQEPDIKKINLIYPNVMYHTLERYRWGFARSYTQLTQSNLTGGRYLYNFDLPNDFIYLRGKYSDKYYKHSIREAELNVVDRVINANSKECYIEYTRYVDEAQLPLYFVEYIKYKLAFDLCMDLTGDTDLLQILDQREKFEWINATNIDARQQRTKEVDTGVYLYARR